MEETHKLINRLFVVLAKTKALQCNCWDGLHNIALGILKSLLKGRGSGQGMILEVCRDVGLSANGAKNLQQIPLMPGPIISYLLGNFKERLWSGGAEKRHYFQPLQDSSDLGDFFLEQF